MQVQLFITCLGEQFFSETLKNLISILSNLEIETIFPSNQVCCGQPLFNNGFTKLTRRVAQNWVEAFSKIDAPIVCPSGSCVSMVKHNYVKLFPDNSTEQKKAIALVSRVFEFTEFLVRVLNIRDIGANYPHKVTYHQSCHYHRELGLKDEAHILLNSVHGLEYMPLVDEEVCCGFGGAFSVTFPEISRSMMNNKIKNIIASGADTVVTCEPGCLMNIAGGLSRAGSNIKVMHIIDLLASK